MNKLFILLILFISNGFADCTFKVTNYSDMPVSVEAGFYGGSSIKFSIGIASSQVAKIKNSLLCNAVSPSGTGVTYINLIDKQSRGGWVYLPTSNMIRAIGASFGSQDYVMGIAPSGTKLVLFNNMKPGTDWFEVRIEKASRNVSRQLGSMN